MDGNSDKNAVDIYARSQLAPSGENANKPTSGEDPASQPASSEDDFVESSYYESSPTSDNSFHSVYDRRAIRGGWRSRLGQGPRRMLFRFDDAPEGQPAPSEDYTGEPFYRRPSPISDNLFRFGYDRWASRGLWNLSQESSAPKEDFVTEYFDDEPSEISDELFRINYVDECWPGMEWAPEEPSDESRDQVLETGWTEQVDNGFASKLFSHNAGLECRDPQIGSPEMCENCGSLTLGHFQSGSFWEIREVQVQKPCKLCKLLRQVLASRHLSQISLSRYGSTFKEMHSTSPVSGKFGYNRPQEPRVVSGHPVLSIRASPDAEGLPDDIQVGFPTWSGPASEPYFHLLREWIRTCDTEHENCRIKQEYLPTRLIDVGTFESEVLRLRLSTRNETERYIALSHRWGQPGDHKESCAYRCNIDSLGSLLEGIDFTKLPKTFQDAVTVARRLEIQFLWIDSLCIIQDDPLDWQREAQEMQSVYSSAYFTIAATAAKDSSSGFLTVEKTSQPTAVFHPALGLYFSQHIDDFKSYVEEAELNQRGWVLQERALSRRTLHFSSAQTFWECGQGIHCETLIKLSK